MNKKIIGIFVCMMLLVTTVVPLTTALDVEVIGFGILSMFSPIAHSSIYNEEIVDQSQTNIGTGCVMYNQYLAQSFKPTKTPLTKVELLLWRDVNPISDMIVSIRESIYGDDLVSIAVPACELPDEYDWVTFDFKDINVSVNKRYYIVYTLADTNPNQGEKIYWSFGWVKGLINGWINDPYKNGRLYMKNDATLGDIWHRGYAPWQGQFDFCFKTYTQAS